MKGKKICFKFLLQQVKVLCKSHTNVKEKNPATTTNLSRTILKAPFKIMVKSFSSLCKLLQITAWANRFIKNCQTNQKITGTLSSSEISEARVQWIKHVQYEVIDTMGVRKLQNNDMIALGLKIDEDGILRCHGRFNNADMPEKTKVPIYLPRKKYWTELLVKKFHQKLFHHFLLDHHINYHKFKTVTGSHKKELL